MAQHQHGAYKLWQAADSANEQQLGSLADLNWKVAGTGDFNADGRSEVL